MCRCRTLKVVRKRTIAHVFLRCDEHGLGDLQNPVAELFPKAIPLRHRRPAGSSATPASASSTSRTPPLRSGHSPGTGRIYQEHASGGRWDRSELHQLLDQLRPGDVLVVWKLDQLSRNLKDLLHLIDQLNSKGVG